ncbi:MAG TPA: hypothetical protein VG889_09820 [Rhizomicrobium sp.]|nr:hypothetical protein [Rhizomicrobium sp.]
MRWQDLQAAVDGLISAGVLTLDQTHYLGSPAILELLTSTQLLSIVATVSTQGYQGTRYVVSGTIARADFPYIADKTGPALPATLDFFVQDAIAQLTATVTMPSGYTLDASFPYMAGSPIRLFPVGAATIGFASAGEAPPPAPSSILLPPAYKGMSITGTMSGLATNPLTEGLLWFVPDRDTFPVSGPVIMSAGKDYTGATLYRPTMYLIGALLEPVALGPFNLGLSLLAQSTYLPIAGSDQSSFYAMPYFFGQLQARITGEKGIDVLLQMKLNAGTANLYSFELSKPIPLTTLNELQQIVPLSGETYSSLVPNEVPIGTGLELTELSFIVAPALNQLALVTAGVKLTVHWEVVPKVFTLEAITLRFTLPDPMESLSGAVATAAAELHVFDGIFDVSVSFPSLQILGQIRQGTVITYANVSRALFGKVLELPGIANPTLYALEVDIQPREQTYSVSGGILDVLSVDLGFVTIELTEIVGAFRYSPLSQSGRFEAQFALAALGDDVGDDERLAFQFFVKAAGTKTGTVTVWNVEGGIAADHAIPLGTLVARLLGFSVGEDVSILDIVQLYTAMTMPSDGPSSFYFEGAAASRWTISLLGDWSVEILAYAQLERRPKDEPSELVLRSPNADDDTEMVTAGELGGSLAINNFKLAVIYQFAPDSQVLIFRASYKQLTLTAALSSGKDDKGQTTALLKFNLSGATLGDIITWMVNLARPDSDFTLDAPWSVLNGIDLSRFALTVDLKAKTVTVAYEVNADFLFLQLKSIGLTYYRKQGKGSVKIAIEGRFLGVKYGDGAPPLEWDLVDDPPPAVPGNSDLFVLRYLGLGQHVSLKSYAAIDTVEQAIEGLRAAMRPPEDPDVNPLLQPGANALNFDANSHWLFGADFTAMGMLQLALVFNDPYIYGGLIRLMGEKAGPLAGLRFELLYKKVTEDIGVYKADLMIPDLFRHLEFGEVSITLGRLHVDIYTNGNFMVDLGFPQNRDFSASFGLQVFPFVGWGGFYFASLTGATSTKVPKIDNGVFNPVIEFGLGLSVGVGKTVEEGPLAAGLTLTLEAILEGVFADFAPTERSAKSAFYFRIEGTAAIVGRLFGKVDFVVIRVDVSAEASARVTLVLECYQPIYIQLELHIDVRASIKILFIRVSFSFATTLDLSFTIGHASATPWHVVSDRSQRLDLLAAPGSDGWPFHRARSPYKRLVRTSRLLRYAASGASSSVYGLISGEQILRGALPSQFFARAEDDPAGWAPVNVFGGEIPVLRLLCAPAFTVADPGIGAQGTPGSYRLVLTMTAETSRDPQALGNPALAHPTVAHSLQAEAVADAPFNLFIEALLRWSLSTVEQNGEVSAVALDALSADLRAPATADNGFAYDNLIAFLKANFTIAIAGKPAGENPDAVPAAAFPMLPLLSYSANGATAVRFDQPQYTLTKAYKEALNAIFYQLSPTGADNAGLADDSVAESFAQYIFRECCLMTAQAAVDGCISLLESFDYPLTATTSLQGICDAFAPELVQVRAKRGQSPEHIAALFGGKVERLAALNPAFASRGRAEAGESVTVAVELTPGVIADLNRDHPLTAVKQIAVPAAPHQIRGDRSLTDIATSYGFASAAAMVTTEAADQKDLLRPDANVAVAQISYTSRAGDTLASVAALYLARRAELGDASAAATLTPEIAQWFAQAVADLNPTTDLGGIVATDTALTVPALYGSTATTATYTSYSGDRLASIADALSLLNVATPPAGLTAYEAAITAANPDLPDPIPAGTAVAIPAFTLALPPRVTLNDLAGGLLQTLDTAIGLVAGNSTALTPQAILIVPAFTIVTAAGDTFASLAQTYDLGYDALGDAAKDIAGLFATDPARVVLKDLPRAGVDQLTAALIEDQGLANQISGQISRFLLHGVQLPSPTAPDPLTAPLQSIFDLTLQQFAGPDPADYGDGATYPIAVTLTDPDDASWISFETSEVVADDATLTALRTRSADFDLRNPAAASHPERLQAGRIVRLDTVAELDIAITQAEMIAGYPTLTFTPSVEAALAPLPLFRLVPQRYGVQEYLTWQAGEPIAVPTSAGSVTPISGGPGIWMFPNSLLKTIAANEGPSAAYELLQVAATDLSSAAETQEVASYGWATLVAFNTKQIARDDDPAQVLPHSYGIGGADQQDRDRLLALYEHLKTMSGSDLAAVRFYLLHRPRADTTRPDGLVSVPLDRTATYILKANLTTETRSGAPDDLARAAGDEELTEIYAAPISDAASFAGLLWAASITNSGGFTLNYQGTDGSDLPAAIFGRDGGGGQVWLMALLPDQTTGTSPSRALYAFNNCAITEGNVLPSDWQLLMQLAQDADTTKVATVDPGVIAFAMALDNPDLATPSNAQIASELFSLLAYGVADTADFAQSYQALPVGPAESATKTLPMGLSEPLEAEDPEDAPYWLYHQGLRISGQAKHLTAPATQGLPPPADDPYAGIGSNTLAKLNFQYRDVFGNQTLPDASYQNIAFPVGYTDPVIGLGQWTGAAPSYQLLPGTTAQLSIALSLQMLSALPGIGDVLAETQTRTANTAKRYAQIYYQVMRPDLAVQLRTSLPVAPDNGQTYRTIDKPPIADFAAAAYLFLTATANLREATADIATAPTLGAVADLYRVTQGQLAAVNGAVPLSTLFDAAMTVPEFHTTAPGESAATVAAANPTLASATAYLTQNATLPLTERKVLAAPAYSIDSGTAKPSLNTLAKDNLCSAAGLGAANAGVANVLAPDLVLAFEEVVLKAQDGETLDAFAARFTQTLLGAEPNTAPSSWTVTASDLAAANADVAPFFADDQTLSVTDAVAGKADTLTTLAARHAEYSIAALAGANTALVDIFPSGLPALIAATTETAPATPLADFAAVRGLSGEQLLSANGATALKSTARLTVPGMTVLPSSIAQPLYIKSGQTLATLGQNFALSADTFATLNQALTERFTGSPTFSANGKQVQAANADSFASLLVKANAAGVASTMSELVALIDAQPASLRPGALYTATSTATAAAMSLQALADLYNVAPAELALANPGQLRFTTASGDVTYQGLSLTVTATDTLNALSSAFARTYGIDAPVGPLAAANATTLQVPAGLMLLLPVRAAVTDLPLDPATVGYPDSIFKIAVALSLVRSDETMLNPNFRDAAAASVRAASCDIPPLAQSESQQTLTLVDQAKQFEAALPGTKLCTGRRGGDAGSGFDEDSPRDLWVVVFGAQGFSKVALTAAGVDFYGLKPLWRKLITRNNVMFKDFIDGGWTANATAHSFQNIDIESWAQSFLSAMDLILSPAYAAALYALDHDPQGGVYAQIAAAKQRLVDAIGAGLAPILDGAPDAGRASAAEKLMDRLKITLSGNYQTTAIVQFPTAVTGTTSHGQARLVGKPLTRRPVTDSATRGLDTLAARFGVWNVYLAEVLAQMPKILNQDLTVTIGQASYKIVPDSTIAIMTAALGQPSIEAFVAALPAADNAVLFGLNIELNLLGLTHATGAASSFAALAQYFDVSVGQVARANANIAGIFASNAVLAYPGKPGVTITITAPATTTLLSAASMFAGEDPPTPEALAQANRNAPVVAGGFAAKSLEIIPEHTLSTGKIDLSTATGAANILFNVASEEQHKKVFLDLDYEINEVEYDIRPVPGAGGYEASEWLSMILPINRQNGAPSGVSLTPGIQEIPVPLRSYPNAPTLLGQGGAPSHPGTADLDAIKRWSYATSYRYDMAEQDVVSLTATLNATVGYQPSSFAGDDVTQVLPLFEALAQFVGVYPQLSPSLASLLKAGGDAAAQRAAAGAFAQMAANIASTWAARWAPAPRRLAARDDETPFPPVPVTFQMTLTAQTSFEPPVLDTVILTLADGSPANVVSFPELTAVWADRSVTPQVQDAGERSRVYAFQPSVDEPDRLIPAFEAVVYRWSFADLNLILQQTAISAIEISRNANLVSSGRTAEAFVFTTPLTGFSTPLGPFVQQPALVDITALGTGVGAALAAALASILAGDPAISRVMRLALQYGYELAPGIGGGEPIISNLPIAFFPQFFAGETASVQAVVDTWLAANTVSQTGSRILLDLTIYSGIPEETDRPVLQIQRLEYRLS